MDGWIKLIGLAVVGIGGLIAVAAVINYLTYNRLLSWFEQREPLLEADRDRVGVSIMEHLSNGNYGVRTGIFDRVTEEVIEQETFEARNVDEQIKQAHQENGYVIYTLS
ncbi:hypothetical protein PA905_34200 [Planktothrix agardhii CCAP 1459/11A]|uniref:Uncharacterized protein n=1 Tax=Planktothrix agardhii CCAP 1459/11A TaxID=282420 RepID=A0A4P5ZZP5_PLAAG|nr:hypothetical protein [Planktothrix agardhii]GDZ95181.1 hypothetical protein PA905_34200 [Planktothrix agardhii CCAP 1459/11A]